MLLKEWLEAQLALVTILSKKKKKRPELITKFCDFEAVPFNVGFCQCAGSKWIFFC